MSNPATVDEIIAAIHALRAAGSKETEISDSDREKAVMKRKMDAARIIENKRIDKL